MARYSYVAQEKSHKIANGTIDAKNRNEALELLRMRGITPLKLTLIEGAEGGPSWFSRLAEKLSLGSSLTAMDQIIVIRELGTILQGGTDLVVALEVIAADAIKPAVRKIMHGLRDSVERGASFHGALLAHKDSFSPIFLNLVKAAEASGGLPAMLTSYAKELRKDNAFSRKIKGALIYPIILVISLLAMIVLILTVVAPHLKELFASLKTQPPFYTRGFFFLSDIWVAHMSSIIAVAIVFAVMMIVGFRIKKTQRYVIGLLWHLPLLHKIQRSLSLMRFSRTIATLINSGFPLKEAVLVVRDVMGPQFRDPLTLIAEKRLEEGVSFSAALAAYPKLFPGMLTSVISTAEKSGHLSASLEDMAEFYEDDVSYSLEMVLTLIEPVLLAVVGIIIGLLAASLIAPLYKVIGSVK